MRNLDCSFWLGSPIFLCVQQNKPKLLLLMESNLINNRVLLHETLHATKINRCKTETLDLIEKYHK